jgi:hypothetical protein
LVYHGKLFLLFQGYRSATGQSRSGNALSRDAASGIYDMNIQLENSNESLENRLFPFGIASGSITVFLVILLSLFSQKNTLTPQLLIVLSFVMFVLYLTGLIQTGIMLFSNPNVHGTCQSAVSNNGAAQGPYVTTLAWLEQNNICGFPLLFCAYRTWKSNRNDLQAVAGMRHFRFGLLASSASYSSGFCHTRSLQ